jgi:hypothetical protein
VSSTWQDAYPEAFKQGQDDACADRCYLVCPPKWMDADGGSTDPWRAYQAGMTSGH